jgi:hypothetical protein
VKNSFKIKTYQHGQRGASASVFQNGREVYKTRIIQGDPWTGCDDRSDRRAAEFAAREWVTEQHRANVVLNLSACAPVGCF